MIVPAIKTTEVTNCKTIKTFRSSKPLAVFLKAPFNTAIGLKPDNTKAGYNPDNNVPIINRPKKINQ